MNGIHPQTWYKYNTPNVRISELGQQQELFSIINDQKVGFQNEKDEF